MSVFAAYSTSFDPFVEADWRISNYTNGNGWIDTSWNPDNVLVTPGEVALQLDGTDRNGKEFSGAEIRSEERHFYGTYEVTMQASPDDGTLSSFFVYSGPAFGTPISEIDFEFLGKDSNQVLLTVHTPEGVDGEVVDLGFDAAAGLHTYSFVWGPDSVSWYADGVLLRAVEDQEIGTPNHAGYTHMSIWTGDNAFTGSPPNNLETEARYTDVSYIPRTAPVALNDRALTAIGESVEIDVLANDGTMGGTPLASSVTIDGAAQHGTVSVNSTTGAITYTPDAGFKGFDTFSYTTSDGTEVSNSGDVEVVVGIPVYATFTSGAEGFVYGDDAFRGTAQPGFASGEVTGGALQVSLGGGNTKSTITDISGGWSQDFSTVAGQEASLTLRYRMTLTEDLDTGEYGEILIAVDGVETVVARLDATDNDDETLDTGWIETTLDLGALAGGDHTLTLGGFLNQRTRANESVEISFDSVTLELGSPSPADDDGNLALTAPDTLIDGTEAGAVGFTIAGLDADATAMLTVSDGTASVTATAATNGPLTLDLTPLTDGPLTTTLTATDGDGATATVQGPGLTLVPASGDDDGNLTLTAVDTQIDGAEMGAVGFTLAGLDADATAVVTVSDGTTSVTATATSDGALTLDLSGLASGPLSSSVTATDTFGSTATVTGPALTLDTTPPPPPPPTPIDATFTSGAEGFVYGDDAFRGTAQPGFASGEVTGGALQVSLGGGNTKSTITDISGGWSQDFSTVAGQEASLTLRYRMTLTEDLDTGEYGEILIAVDGVETVVARLDATDNDDETLDTGWIETTLDLGALAGGDHTLTLGGFLNQRTRANESVEISFDSVTLELGSPSPADDDGNLALTAPDTLIDGTEAGAVGFTIAGLDADATAMLTVSDGTASVTATAATNGPLTLDLTPLTDGPLTTTLTATDGDGATATVQGPGLTLVPASGDDDGNLTLTAVDTQIDGAEMGAVGFTLAGLDADATAVVTVSDGTTSVTATATSDGALTLDLSGLASGPLSSSVTATDTFGSTATVTGPALTLDTTPPPPPPPTPIDATFTSGAEGFVYGDDAFRGTAQPGFASGEVTGGALQVSLGGGNTKSTITDISGGWSQDFSTVAGQEASLTLRYRMTLTEDLDTGEYGEILIAVDGVETVVARLDATDNDDETLDTGWIETTLDLGALAGGDHTLTLGGFLNQRTRANESVEISFDSVTLELGSPSPADDDGNLALTAPDTLIDGTEAGAVGFTIAGLDADATAMLTVSDGTASVTATAATNGPLTLDLTPLTDGPLTTTLTATDGDGATATVQGPGLTLVPASGDDDGNLTLTAVDTQIDGAEMGAVGFTLAGLDADATAVVTVSDGTTSVTATATSDGALTLDLSGLASGPLSSSVTATDTFGSTATVTGPALTLDTTPPPPPPPTPIDATFTSGAEGFVYGDDAFRGTAQPGFASGEVTGGALQVSLGGGNTKSTITDISGGWSQDFSTVAGQEASLTLRYRMTLTEDLDTGEYGEILIAVDGVETVVARLDATDNDDETLDTGWIETTLDLGALAGGDHTLTLGGFLNQRTRANESVEISFDSVTLELGSPSPADDDGNLALTAPDTLIDGTEAGAVGFTIAGLDADATAMLTVSDGTASVTATAATNGPLTLDLTPLTDGPLTTTLTATDGDGATATVQGPGLTLDTAPPVDLNFETETDALIIDLEAAELTTAARVLAIGDSLTHGYLGGDDPETVNNRGDQDGYRGKLFEGLLAQDAFIDYVGAFSSGPGDLIDQEHTGAPSRQLRQLLNSAAEDYHFKSNVIDTDADIVLLMAGTNDFSTNGDLFFTSFFPAITARIEEAVNVFYSVDGADQIHLVISTIPAKLRLGDAFVSEIVNEGYSIVNGDPVVGDAGNGTYLPGIKAVVQSLMPLHPTLHLHDAPFDPALIGPDLVHMTDAGYTAFADSLRTLIETEIGLTDGTIDGAAQSIGAALNVEGGSAGDWISGSALANLIRGGLGNDILDGRGGADTLMGDTGRDRLDGGAGADVLTGGADADTFVFRSDFAADTTMSDQITDFGLGGDILLLDDIFSGQVIVTDISGGVRLSVASVGTIDVFGTGAQSLKGDAAGAGAFELTTDNTIVTYFADSLPEL